MNCEMLQSRLSAYLDGELSGRDMLAIRSHLHQCPECANILEIERLTKEALAGIPTLEPPADFEERLVAKVMASPVRATRAWQFGAAFVMTSVAAFAVTLGYLQASKSTSPTPTVANTYEAQKAEVIMTQWDPYGGGMPVITTPKRNDGN
jgi:anti-sigma factor RsiW